MKRYLKTTIHALGIFVILTLLHGSALANDAGGDEHVTVLRRQRNARAEERIAAMPISQKPLILVGEGGEAGSLFSHAARTYQEEHGGVIVAVHDGNAFIRSLREFVAEHGRITTLVYFGHGNAVGLYVNQHPTLNAAVYVNDPSLNTAFPAASIFELPSYLFAPGSSTVFYGCNVAEGYPENDSFAEIFANHFRTNVKAARGPTEFSRRPDAVDPFANANALPAGFDQSVYMIPTRGVDDWTTLLPQHAGVGGYRDVYVDTLYDDAIAIVAARSFRFSDESQNLFHPRTIISYGEARDFCALLTGDRDQCTLPGYTGEHYAVRNLHALRILIDTLGIDVGKTPGSHSAYVRWALDRDLLTPGFIHRKWYTREEMAQLTVNILKWREANG